MKRFFLVLLCVAMTATSLYAQGVGINAANKAADPSAMLDVSSTNQGMLVPRMTAAQRTGIASPATGLLVYQTDAPAGFYYNAGTPTTPNWLALHVMLAGSPVGTTDVQTLTNKDITDNSNYVLSRGLWANSGSGSVSTYFSPVPTAGAVLTATSGSAASWSPPRAPGSYFHQATNSNWTSSGYPEYYISTVPPMKVTIPSGPSRAVVFFSAFVSTKIDPTVQNSGIGAWLRFYANGQEIKDLEWGTGTVGSQNLFLMAVCYWPTNDVEAKIATEPGWSIAFSYVNFYVLSIP